MRSDFLEKFTKISFLALATLPFFMFFLYEILSGNFNLSRIILGLPFLIFPVIFLMRPKFIEEYIFNLSLLIFQISVLLQSFI